MKVNRFPTNSVADAAVRMRWSASVLARLPKSASCLTVVASPERGNEDSTRSGGNDIGKCCPFYNVDWDPGKGVWADLGRRNQVGHGRTRPARPTAMTDNPSDPFAQSGRGAVVNTFETCAVCIYPFRVYGCIKWGYKVPDMFGAEPEILGATREDFSLSPSAVFWDALVRYWMVVGGMQVGSSILFRRPIGSFNWWLR